MAGYGVGLTNAAMAVAADALQDVLLYAQLHSGPAGDGTANIACTTRKAITWGSVTGPGSFGLASSLNFTGGTAGGDVYSVTLWSASTSGVCYGEFLTSGSAVLDGSGNYVLSSLDIVGGPVISSATPPAVVEYDATGGTGAKGGPASSWTWSHTIGSDANAVVVAVIEVSNPIPTFTAKCGGVDMTLIGECNAYHDDGSFYTSVHLYGLLNPSTGTQTMTVTSSPVGAFVYADSVSYKNVTSFGTEVTSRGTTESPSITVPTTPGAMVAGGFGGYLTALAGANGNVRFSSPWVYGSNRAGLYQDCNADDRSTEATLRTAVNDGHWGAVAVPMNP